MAQQQQEQIVDSAVYELSPKHTISFSIKDFENLSHERGEDIVSPELSCHGHLWTIAVYPRGSPRSSESTVHVSVVLTRENMQDNETVKAKFSFRVGNKTRSTEIERDFVSESLGWGWTDFVERSTVLDPAEGYLENGVLTVKADIQIVLVVKPEIWRPRGTLQKDVKELFESMDFSDVTFSVGGHSFQAHKNILAMRASGLAETFQCESGKDKGEAIVIDGFDPSVFQAFLHHAYLDELPGDADTCKDVTALLDLADKFGCTSLKLCAEAKLAESFVSDDNVIDMILDADSKNCPLLKEAALKFFVDNKEKLMRTEAFRSIESPRLLQELIAADFQVRANDQGASVENMGVSTLRRKLDEAGHDVDGTRETLVKRLKTAANAEGVKELSEENSDSDEENSDSDDGDE